MSNLSRHAPHSSEAGFSHANSYSLASADTFFVKARRGSYVSIYISADEGGTWSLSQTIDATNSSESIVLTKSAGDTLLNVVSTTTKEVMIIPVPGGLPVHGQNLSQPFGAHSEAISTTEKAAAEARISAMESKSFSPRAELTLAADTGRVAGTPVDCGSNFSNIIGKSHMIFVNGLVLHSDDYAINEADNGLITFNIDMTSNCSLNIFVLE